jgi:hypothetical protein
MAFISENAFTKNLLGWRAPFLLLFPYSEAGDIADPGDEIFRVLISAVSAVPVQPAIHFLVAVLQAYSQIGDDCNGGVVVTSAVSDPPVFCAAYIILAD